MTPKTASNLDRIRLNIVLLTVFINISAVICFTFFPWSDWRTGMVLNLIDNAILIGYTLTYKDRFMGHLLLFGFVVGIVELAADAWLVDVTHTLDYSVGGGPILWRSPLWMPLAWEVVCVQFGYIGLRLWERLGLKGLLLTGFLGAINIPFYEEMALHINWWAYQNCKMFLHTPWYIIAGEFLIVICLGILTKLIQKNRIMTTITAGIAGGLAIFFSYTVSYQIFK